MREVAGDRRMSLSRKGKRFSSTHVYDLETMAPTVTENRWEKVQVYENNTVRRIGVMKRADKRRMEDPKEWEITNSQREQLPRR